MYSDPEVFELERERIFGAGVGLRGPRVRDPRRRRLRRAPHRRRLVHRRPRRCGVGPRACSTCASTAGMQVCRAELGTASHFRCPYHAWTYRNDGSLVGLPFHDDAYGGEAGFRGRRTGAAPRPPRSTSINGLIFVSLDPDAPPLREFLGDFAFYLDFYSQAERRRASSSAARSAGESRATGRSAAENFVRRQLPHAAHPPQRGRDRPLPRAEGEQAQGGRAVLRRQAAVGPRTSCRPATSTSRCATSAIPTR